jgi:hypothetical protein
MPSQKPVNYDLAWLDEIEQEIHWYVKVEIYINSLPWYSHSIRNTPSNNKYTNSWGEMTMAWQTPIYSVNLGNGKFGVSFRSSSLR